MAKRQLLKLEEMAGLTIAPDGIVTNYDDQEIIIFFTNGSFICLETEYYDWDKARIGVETHFLLGAEALAELDERREQRAEGDGGGGDDGGTD